MPGARPVVVISSRQKSHPPPYNIDRAPEIHFTTRGVVSGPGSADLFCSMQLKNTKGTLYNKKCQEITYVSVLPFAVLLTFVSRTLA
jgi:hypothetical protein